MGKGREWYKLPKCFEGCPLYQRVVSPLQVCKVVEVGGKVMGVNEVGKMVEVGGEVMEVDEVGDEAGEVVECMGEGGGGDQGVEAGRVDALEEGRLIKRLIDPRLPTEEEVDHHKLTHLPYRNRFPEC